MRDVLDPGGADVAASARDVHLTGSADDSNAEAWHCSSAPCPSALKGNWSSRWHGEDVEWHEGHGTLRIDGERVRILFGWDAATKQGLIEALRDGGDRLIGRYLNLNAPEITRPWPGMIIYPTRIDDEHRGGRLDFRR